MKGEDNDWAPLREDSEPKDKKITDFKIFFIFITPISLYFPLI
jgi:hypothetical protein